VVFVEKYAHLEYQNPIMKGNLRCINQNVVQSVLLAKEIVQQWQLYYKSERVVDVYGMHAQ